MKTRDMWKREIGKVYNGRKILGRVSTNECGASIFRVMCLECGAESNLRKQSILNNSCGYCYHKNRVRKTPPNNGSGNRALPGNEAAKRVAFRSCKQNAKYRSIEWNLGIEQFHNITRRNCHYCGLPPNNKRIPNRANGAKESEVYYYSGLDRINNDRGYFMDNIVPCCKICNRARNNMTYTDFMGYINKLVSYRIKCSTSTKNVV